MVPVEASGSSRAPLGKRCSICEHHSNSYSADSSTLLMTPTTTSLVLNHPPQEFSNEFRERPQGAEVPSSLILPLKPLRVRTLTSVLPMHVLECHVVLDPKGVPECTSPLPVRVPPRAKLGPAFELGFSAPTFHPVFASRRKQRRSQDSHDDSFGAHYISYSAPRANQLDNFNSL